MIIRIRYIEFILVKAFWSTFIKDEIAMMYKYSFLCSQKYVQTYNHCWPENEISCRDKHLIRNKITYLPIITHFLNIVDV